MNLAFVPLLLSLVLISLAAASPNETAGIVTHVVDGDTFDVQLQDHDSRITEDLVRIRFADIDWGKLPPKEAKKLFETARELIAECEAILNSYSGIIEEISFVPIGV